MNVTVAQEKQAVAQRITWISVAINLVLAAVQVSVGIVANSQALIADGVHSLSDFFADGIVLLANKRSDAAPDHDHNYGHSRYETVASFLLGALLIAVGAGMLGRAVVRLMGMEGAPDVHFSALLVAVIALVAKEGLFRFMLREAERVRSSMLIANAWHARSDAASSLVVGLGILASLLGYKALDPIAASIVGFMVARMGWSFGWNAMQDLSDRALDDADATQMRDVLQGTPGVREVTELKTRKMGDSALVDAHLLVDPRISVSEGHYIAESARERLKQDVRILEVLIHIDPENDEQERTTTLGLPMRAELLDRTRAAFRPLGIPVDTIDLHYLHGAIDLDVYVQTVVYQGLHGDSYGGAIGGAHDDAPSGTDNGTDNHAGNRTGNDRVDVSMPVLVPEKLPGHGHAEWHALDLKALAATLGVRQVKVFFGMTQASASGQPSL